MNYNLNAFGQYYPTTQPFSPLNNQNNLIPQNNLTPQNNLIPRNNQVYYQGTNNSQIPQNNQILYGNGQGINNQMYFGPYQGNNFGAFQNQNNLNNLFTSLEKSNKPLSERQDYVICSFNYIMNQHFTGKNLNENSILTIFRNSLFLFLFLFFLLFFRPLFINSNNN
jgi:hypothetical protein